MDYLPEREWKHTTASSIFEAEDDGIDLFDDEQPGHVTIYKRLKNGNRWPARSVCLENYDHATSVLGAWIIKGKVNDYRTFGKQATIAEPLVMQPAVVLQDEPFLGTPNAHH